MNHPFPYFVYTNTTHYSCELWYYPGLLPEQFHCVMEYLNELAVLVASGHYFPHKRLFILPHHCLERAATPSHQRRCVSGMGWRSNTSTLWSITKNHDIKYNTAFRHTLLYSVGRSYRNDVNIDTHTSDSADSRNLSKWSSTLVVLESKVDNIFTHTPTSCR